MTPNLKFFSHPYSAVPIPLRVPISCNIGEEFFSSIEQPCIENISTKGERLLESVDWFEDAYLAAQKSDLIVILTEWNEFRALDLKKISKSMNSPRLADLRNIYSADQVLKEGFDRYIGVGRKDINL